MPKKNQKGLNVFYIFQIQIEIMQSTEKAVILVKGIHYTPETINAQHKF